MLSMPPKWTDIIRVGLAAGLCTVAFSTKAVSYTAIELGPLGGRTYAHAINNAGQVVGSFSNPGSATRAFVTGSNGVGFFDLGTLPGTIDSIATGINDSGMVVGFSSTLQATPSAYIRHAFVTGPNGTGMSALGNMAAADIDNGGSFGPLLANSWAYGINNAGQVTGVTNVSYFRSLRLAGFVTGANGVGMVAATTPTLALKAGLAINESGQIAGLSINERASFTESNGGATTDINLPGSFSSEAVGINDSGQVVGSAFVGGTKTAFITGPNGIGSRFIGSFGGNSSAFGINNAGQVVGTSFENDDPGRLGDRAFITEPDGVGMIDLNTLVTFPGFNRPVTLTEARAINDIGQVVALGANGRAFLLSPVPEPAMFPMLIAGIGLLTVAVRRRRVSAAKPFRSL